ncbi:MAG: hypothetical protein KDA96_14345 [Planctomycetaceae bacterium]|nr:hypothetical protein [Planctomycetaceae bacterium]
MAFCWSAAVHRLHDDDGRLQDAELESKGPILLLMLFRTKALGGHRSGSIPFCHVLSTDPPLA